MKKTQRSATPPPVWIEGQYPVPARKKRGIPLTGVWITVGVVVAAYLAKWVAVAVMIGMMYLACDPSKGSC